MGRSAVAYSFFTDELNLGYLPSFWSLASQSEDKNPFLIHGTDLCLSFHNLFFHLISSSSNSNILPCILWFQPCICLSISSLLAARFSCKFSRSFILLFQLNFADWIFSAYITLKRLQYTLWEVTLTKWDKKKSRRFYIFWELKKKANNPVVLYKSCPQQFPNKNLMLPADFVNHYITSIYVTTSLQYQIHSLYLKNLSGL